MKQKLFYSLLPICLFVFLNACSKESVDLNFQEKEVLKESSKFLVQANWGTPKEYLSLFDISNPKKFRKIFSIAGRNQSFVLQPNGKSVFINNKDMIFQINPFDGSVQKKLSLKNVFPKKWKEYAFDKLITASDSKLWFLVSSPQKHVRSNNVYVWEFKFASPVCKVTDFRFQTKHIVATVNNKTIANWFYLKDNEPLKIPTHLLKGSILDYNFADYSEEKGWILSAAYPEPDYNNIEFITYINPKNEVITLCKGGLAVFGNDDFVYFVRKQATVWRISLKTKKEELVFIPSNLFAPKDKDLIDFFPPQFNKEKTLMMFPYEQQKKERNDLSLAVIVVFDFINKEYRILKHQLNQTSSLRHQEPKWLNITKRTRGQAPAIDKD